MFHWLFLIFQFFSWAYPYWWGKKTGRHLDKLERDLDKAQSTFFLNLQVLNTWSQVKHSNFRRIKFLPNLAHIIFFSLIKRCTYSEPCQCNRSNKIKLSQLYLHAGIKLSDSGLRIMNRFLDVLNQKQHFFNFSTNHK